MGLFTKLFNKNFDPYVLPGRWYKVRIENGTIKSSDLPANFTLSITSNYLVIADASKKYNVLFSNIKYLDVYNTGLTSGTAMNGLRYSEFLFNTNTWRTTIAPSSSTTSSVKTEVYLYLTKL